MKHILLVDATANPQHGIHYGLVQAGFRVTGAASIEEALQIAQQDPADLVLLVKTCAGAEGFSGLLHLKQVADMPVICLSAKHRNVDEVTGLEMGADDYLTLPLRLDVLAARIKAVLRRSGVRFAPSDRLGETLAVGDLILNPVEHTVSIGARAVHLRRREFQLLQTFLEHPGEVLSISDLLALVWGNDYTGQPQVVYVTVRWLRQKIEDDPKHPLRIITVPSIGYKFNCEL